MEKSAALCLLYLKEVYEPHEIRVPVLEKNGGTILAIGASVGVVLTAIETGKASIKAEKLIEMNSAEPAYTMKEKVQDCWKFYLPAAALGAGTIACILGSNALNKKQIASLTAGYMALGKAYQEYRREVAEHVGAEHEKEIYKDAQSVLKEPTSDMVEDKLLCYEPISKRYFHATEAALLEAFYSLNRDFALNGYASMNDLYNYLGLDYIPEGDLKGGVPIILQPIGNISGSTSAISNRKQMMDWKSTM